MKHFLPIIILIFSFTSCFPQAPDFSFTDTDGKHWNLYEELAKGNSVVLDFFYADCVPCQTFTPGIIDVKNDYSATGKLLVWGISDRDNNTKIKAFEDALGVNYPSGGTEGGGDTITDLYKSWYTFLGWPTYAVICPDKTITWDLPRKKEFPELRAAIDSCAYNTSIKNAFSADENFSVYPIPASKKINIKTHIRGSSKMLLIDAVSGKTMVSENILPSGETFTLDLQNYKPGLYILILQTENETAVFKVPLVK